MIRLDSGNVLLKPSNRKQLMGWLRRAVRLGEQVGDFMLTLSMQRIGSRYELRASVHDSAGDFGCRSRQRQWQSAARDVTAALTSRLHEQHLVRA